MNRYSNIVKTLKTDIEAGRYVSAFPSEAQLVKRFSVSRQTIVRVMNELKEAGLVERRRGSGTFVSRKQRQALGTIGLVLPWFVSSPFVRAMSNACRKEGYTLLFRDISEAKCLSAAERAREACDMAHEFASAKVAGVLMQPLQNFDKAAEISRELINAFRVRGIPVVLVDHDAGGMTEKGSGCDVIGVDNFRVGYEVGRHLAAQGAKRIVFLMHADWAPTVTERMHGVAAAAIDAGLSWRANRNVVFCKADDAKGIARALRTFRADAIACGNDVEAARLLKTLRALRISVPKRILVTGVDDAAYAAILSPSLTSVAQPFDEIARAAAERLFWRIRHPKDSPASILLPTKLIVRESTTRQ